MKSKLSVFLLLLLNCLFAFGTTTIKGNAPAYAGAEIKFYQLADPISKEKIELFQLKVDPNGDFQINVKLDKVTHAVSEFDSYSADIYLVPNKTYELVLPPLKKVTSSERHNPFFKPIHVHLAIKESERNELNRKIREFEQAFQLTEKTYFDQIYRKKLKSAVDSIHAKLGREFPKGADPFFNDYKFYRLAFAEFALHQGKSEDFINKYFNSDKTNFEIAPFNDLFNRTFTNYFAQLSNTIDGENFRKLIANSNPVLIENHLIDAHHLNREIARLVILKSIHDAFHQGQFSQKTLINILSKIKNGSWSANHKKIAERLDKKLTHLLPGTNAPAISFNDLGGKKYTLSDFDEQLIYLHFTRVSNPICRQHLDALKELPEAVRSEVKILNLILEEEASQKTLIEKQNWLGQFFVIDDKTTEEWRVRSFPTAFLIDGNKKLIYSPASNPLDGFNRQIGMLLHKKHMLDRKNQAK